MLTFYTPGKEKRIALMRDSFIPVILDGYLRGTRVERDFLKRVELVGNGFTYLTAGGVKLGGDSYLGANGLESALTEFARLPESVRRPSVERASPQPPTDPADLKGLPQAPPPGCLIANVYFTYLERSPARPSNASDGWRRALWHVEGQPGTEPGSGHGRNQFLTHVDKLWLTETEWRSLLPQLPQAGQRYPLPRGIHDRIARFYANDMAHRSTNDTIRRAELSLVVESANAAGMALRLEGTVETGCAFESAPLGGKQSEAPGLCGADYRFLGRLHYDAKMDTFDRFDIVALGEGWGGGRERAATTNFYRGGEHRPWPMGIAFRLVTTRRPIDRLPPQNANEYRCGNAYFAASKQAPREAPRGTARAEATRPRHFPHRLWAACDFESRLSDYAWFGPAETKEIPAYPGNTTALGVSEKPYGTFSALMTGINPVPGPCMGKVNSMYCRYLLRGGSEATFQHFSLSSNDNNHIRVSGLTEGKWSEVTLNFSRQGQRNDGTPGVPFKEGERMDDLKIFVGKPGDGRDYQLFIDDVIFFADDPEQPIDPEPFPHRVIYVAGFDTGVDAASREKYFPGQMEIVRQKAPPGTYWGAARAVPIKDGKEKLVQLQVTPSKAVGAHTKLRFRYHLTGVASMQVQIFDVTDMDNRHVRLRDLKQGEWTFLHVDFTKDGKRNDGSSTPFAAGHQVDDIFFFVDPSAELLIDEVVLYDAGRN